MTVGCRHDVNQSNIRYSDIKQSLLRDKDSINIKLVEPKQEAAETDHKSNCDVKKTTKNRLSSN